VSLSGSNPARLNFHCWTLDEAPRLFVTGKERVDLFPQRLVTSAGVIKKRRALAGISL
jgi:hypothetical protein